MVVMKNVEKCVDIKNNKIIFKPTSIFMQILKDDWVFILEVFWLIFILLILGLSLGTIIY